MAVAIHRKGSGYLIIMDFPYDCMDAEVRTTHAIKNPPPPRHRHRYLYHHHLDDKFYPLLYISCRVRYRKPSGTPTQHRLIQGKAALRQLLLEKKRLPGLCRIPKRERSCFPGRSCDWGWESVVSSLRSCCSDCFGYHAF